MAQWLNVGTINNTQKGGFRILLSPEYVSPDNYSYDSLISLYEELGNYLEKQPKNEAGYPEGLGLHVKDIHKELQASLDNESNKQMTQDLFDKISHRRRFEKYDIQLIID